MSLNHVYMVMYQYAPTDYSVICIMTSLDKAYDKCKNQHIGEVCNLVELNHNDHSDNCLHKCDSNVTNILYCNSFDYYKLETIDTEYISQYIIVSVVLDT